MKRVLCALLFFALPALATMSQRQSPVSQWNSSSSTTCSATLGSGYTQHDLIVVWTYWNTGSSSNNLTASVQDHFGNSYVSAVGPTLQSVSNTAAQIFYVASTAFGSGTDPVTVTYSGSASTSGCVFVEYQGADQNYPLDSVSAGYSTSGNPTGLLDSGAVAPANANLLVFGGGIIDNGTASAGSGFTIIQAHTFTTGGAITEQNTNAISGNNVLQRATACTGTTLPCPANPTPTGNWVMQMAVFRDASWTVGGGWSPARQGNILYADQFPSIAAAVAALPATGGTVVIPAHYRATLTSTLVLGGAAQAVHLECNKDATVTFNITDGTSWGIQMYNGSSIHGADMTPVGTNAQSGCTFAEAPGFQGAGLLTNAQTTGNQAYLDLSHVTFRGDTAHANANANALVYLNALAGDPAIDHVFIYNFPGVGLWLTGVTNGISVVNFDEVWIVGTGSADSSQPLLISPTSGQTAQSFNFFGGFVQFPGCSQYDVEINGNAPTGSVNPAAVNFYGTHFEQDCVTQSKALMRINDFKGVGVWGGSAIMQNLQYFASISESSAGRVDNVNIYGLQSLSGINCVTNSVDGSSQNVGATCDYRWLNPENTSQGQIGGMQYNSSQFTNFLGPIGGRACTFINLPCIGLPSSWPGTAVLGMDEVCSDCQVTTASGPFACSTANPGGCVCKGGATSSYVHARYMNYEGNGNNWYCQ